MKLRLVKEKSGRDVAQVVEHSPIKVWTLMQGGSIMRGKFTLTAIEQGTVE